MSWLGFPTRLADDPQATRSPLTAALREWQADHGDSMSVARLERRLAAEFAAPVVVPGSSAAPWWFGVSVMASVVVVLLCVASGRHAHSNVSARAAANRSSTPAVIAGTVAVDARQLASEAPGAVLFGAVWHPSSLRSRHD